MIKTKRHIERDTYNEKATETGREEKDRRRNVYVGP